MNTTMQRSFAHLALRTMQASLLALALLPSTLGPAAPASAEPPPPDVRIQVQIKSVIIHNDMDWGDGDIMVGTQVRANSTGCGNTPEKACGRLLVGSLTQEFHA